MVDSADVTATADPARTRRARRGIGLYLALVVVFAAVFDTLLLTTGNVLWIIALMWSVALASIITRLVRREGFGDVSFRFGGRDSWRYIAVGLLFPVVIGLVAFGIAWLTGLAEFRPTSTGLVAAVVPADASPAVVFVVGLVLSATVGTVFGVLTTTGEELGWRGYLLTRLIDADVPHPVLVSGIIWGLWHIPLILGGIIYADHPSKVVAVLVFMVSVTAMGFIVARFRLRTGSIWPPIAAHSAYNSVIQSGFSPATAGLGAAVWVGQEAGLLVAAMLVVTALVLCRGSWTYLRAPGEPMRPPRSAL